MITEYHTLISFFYKGAIKPSYFFVIGFHNAAKEAYTENNQDRKK